MDFFKDRRRERFDAMQAEVRTTAQNEAILKIIEETPNGNYERWAYSTVTYKGETVELQQITPERKRWRIVADGTVTVIEPD